MQYSVYRAFKLFVRSSIKLSADLDFPLTFFFKLFLPFFFQLAENNDAIWDDGVAPELALDFDMPHMSSREALGTFFLGFGTFFVFFQFLKLIKDPDTDNPALPHSSMCVDEDHGMVGEAKPNN